MLKKIVMVTTFLLSSSGTIAFAGTQDGRLDELINQLNGKSCKYEMQANLCVSRKPFASFSRRSDKIFCIVDAAKALGIMGHQAQNAVPSLIDALKKYRNHETGDGLIQVRSEIALALGQIKDSRAIIPLIEVLKSEDPISSRPDLLKYKELHVNKTSYGAVAEALGMFGEQAEEAVPYIVPILKFSGFRLESAHSQAAKALGRIKSEEAIAALIDALNSSICRTEAAEELGNFGSKAKEALPVFKAATQGRLVYLPNGPWLKVIGTAQGLTGEQLQQGGDRFVAATLEEVPLFLRAGALIPMATPGLHTSAEPQHHYRLLGFTDSSAQCEILLDDGETRYDSWKSYPKLLCSVTLQDGSWSCSATFESAQPRPISLEFELWNLAGKRESLSFRYPIG